MNIKHICLAASIIPFSSQAMTLIIDIPSQTYRVEDAGMVLNKGIVSSGKKGYDTPRGEYIVQMKIKNAYSNKYKAKMPNFLMFSGNYGIHAGNALKKFRSHGCVRVPFKDSVYLYNVIPAGTRVVIK